MTKHHSSLISFETVFMHAHIAENYNKHNVFEANVFISLNNKFNTFKKLNFMNEKMF